MGWFDFMQEAIAIDLGTANTLIIYNPITKVQTTRQISNWIVELKSIGNTIYYRDWQSIFSLDLTTSTTGLEVTLISNLGQDSSIRTFDVVGSTLYYYIEN